MNIIKMLFWSRKPSLDKPAVSGNLSFREQMKQDIIPRVWQMAEKEKEHLNWLMGNNAPKKMIETSQRYLIHFMERHKEYNSLIKEYKEQIAET